MSMPLKEIRVLDLTRLLPGAYCTQFLADFGAEVIKVEEPELGDFERWYEPSVGEYSAIFASLNRNKKSITLNLKEEKEKQALLELVKTADVFVESFRPGVMKRLGLDYETLKKINPGLIYCAISGYGQTGPLSKEPGFDPNYLSYAGLLNYQGDVEQKPSLPSIQIADIGGGSLMAAIGILIAIINKRDSGKGQFIDISMTDGVISLLQTILPNYLAGANPTRGELAFSGANASYNVYETKDKRYLTVAAATPKFWKVFCEKIEREDFIPLLDGSLEIQATLKKEIESIIQMKALNEWLEVFGDVESCVAPVLTLEEMVNHPHVKSRDMIINTENPNLGTLPQIGFPIKLSDTPGKIQSKAPTLGEHNEEVLEEIFRTLSRA